MGGALCRRCDNYLGSGRWRCFSKVRCLSAASSDFWKTLLATFQSLSSFHLLQSAPPICQLLGCAHRPVAESEQFEIVFNDAWQ